MTRKIGNRTLCIVIFCLVVACVSTKFTNKFRNLHKLLECFGIGLSNLQAKDLLNLKLNFRPKDPNIGRNTIELIQAQGFPVESHFVTTEDGYILNLFRIPNPRPSRGVAFLSPGLLLSSDNWLLNYRDKNLPYILAWMGYDVWLGNNRGNIYGTNHTIFDPFIQMSQFWDFSWHEMGLYDLPASVDYVLHETNQKSLYYIGHSQGTLQYFVGVSLRPELNTKIRLMVALAPAIFDANVFSIAGVFASISNPVLVDPILSAIGTDGSGGFLSNRQEAVLNSLAPLVCETPFTTTVLCDTILFLIFGFDYSEVENELIPSLVNHFPQGSSLKTVLHYAQLVNNGQFQQFDYGPGFQSPLFLHAVDKVQSLLAFISPPDFPGLIYIINKVLKHVGFASIPTTLHLPEFFLENLLGGNPFKYGWRNPSPPKYDLSQVTAPVVLYVGPNDAFADVTDVARLAPLIPGNIDRNNATPYRVVNFRCFNHLDFNGVARDIDKLLYNQLVQLLQHF